VLTVVIDDRSTEQLGQHWHAFVEHRTAGLLVDNLTSAGQFPVRVYSESDAECDASAAETVNGDDLTGELEQTSTNKWRDHGSDAESVGLGCDHTQAHPRIDDLVALRPQDMVPKKETIPTSLLTSMGEIDQPVRIGQGTEGRDEDGVAHAPG
jgi:hypothetical protein